MKSLKICLIFIAKRLSLFICLSYENQAFFGMASFLLLVMKFRPKIEKIIKKNKKMSSAHNFVDFDDENHNTKIMEIYKNFIFLFQKKKKRREKRSHFFR